MTFTQLAGNLSVRGVTPQAQRAFTLLTNRGDRGVSTLEAAMAYSMPRFAARVCELRNVGIDVRTERKVDEKGQPYARYRLVA